MTGKPCKRCVLEGPWRFDDDGNVTGRCDCRTKTAAASPEVERDEAIAATVDANTNAMRAALRIIHDAAINWPTFSSNTIRGDITVAQVPGPVVGAAFRQAAKNGWVRADAYEPSTDAGTHGHPVRTWVSLIWRRAA